MKQLNLFIAASFFFCLFSNFSYAQEVKIPTDTTQLISLETKDGNEFVGYIRSFESGVVVIKTESFGEVRVRKQDIKTIRNIGKNQLVEGKYWYESPNTTRYFFGPNGYNLRKGEGYYQNTWIWFNQISYGVSNNFTIGAGIVPLFVFAGAPSPVWVTPKVSIPIKKDKLNLGVGGLFGFILGENSTSFGVAYGQMTVGSRDKNFNLGLGYGYADGNWANAPTVSLSGIYRTGKHFALMTENYFFGAGKNNYLLMSAGGRFILKRIAIDAGLVIPTQTDGAFIGIPWLGISVPFGRPSGS